MRSSLFTSHFPLSPRARGSLLLELLIAISVLGIILSVAAQAMYVSLQSGKVSGESDVAVGLASEALEATRSVAEEKWQNIYDLTKGAQYHMVRTNNKWATSTASETITLNTATYTRYVVIENVSRNASTRMIDTGTNYDPSTQKVTVTVSWQGSGSPVTVSNYFLRWRNKVCNQTNWSTSGSSGVKTCPDTTYVSSANLGVPGTSLQIQ